MRLSDQEVGLFPEPKRGLKTFVPVDGWPDYRATEIDLSSLCGCTGPTTRWEPDANPTLFDTDSPKEKEDDDAKGPPHTG